MAKQKLSKAQISKEVRRVLLQYGVNLSDMYFSAGVSSILLTGHLNKTSGRDFTNEEMFQLTQDLLKIGNIRCELENWMIGSDGVHYIGKPDGHNVA